jgi:RNA polymerase sigma factor (sigma-70 family)
MRDPLADPAPLIRRVYAYVSYRVGAGPHAEDITSEVFERALRYRHSFDGRRGDAAAWLVGIARRCIADHVAAPAEVTIEGVAGTAGGYEDSSLSRLDLQRAVAALDDRDRELVALRYGADLTARQIAELLGQRVNTIEVALHRTLGRLREELERP